VVTVFKVELCSGCKYGGNVFFLGPNQYAKTAFFALYHQFFITRWFIKYIICYYKFSCYYFVYWPNIVFL